MNNITIPTVDQTELQKILDDGYISPTEQHQNGVTDHQIQKLGLDPKTASVSDIQKGLFVQSAKEKFGLTSAQAAAFYDEVHGKDVTVGEGKAAKLSMEETNEYYSKLAIDYQITGDLADTLVSATNVGINEISKLEEAGLSETQIQEVLNLSTSIQDKIASKLSALANGDSSLAESSGLISASSVEALRASGFSNEQIDKLTKLASRGGEEVLLELKLRSIQSDGILSLNELKQLGFTGSDLKEMGIEKGSISIDELKSALLQKESGLSANDPILQKLVEGEALNSTDLSALKALGMSEEKIGELLGLNSLPTNELIGKLALNSQHQKAFINQLKSLKIDPSVAKKLISGEDLDESEVQQMLQAGFLKEDIQALKGSSTSSLTIQVRMRLSNNQGMISALRSLGIHTSLSKALLNNEEISDAEKNLISKLTGLSTEQIESLSSLSSGEMVSAIQVMKLKNDLTQTLDSEFGISSDSELVQAIMDGTILEHSETLEGLGFSPSDISELADLSLNTSSALSNLIADPNISAEEAEAMFNSAASEMNLPQEIAQRILQTGRISNTDLAELQALGITESQLIKIQTLALRTVNAMVNTLATAQGVSFGGLSSNAISTVSALGAIEGASAAPTISISPPKPEITMDAFFSSLVAALAAAITAKADMMEMDGIVNEMRLNDIILQSEQKIEHADVMNKIQVKALKQMIDHLETMRWFVIGMYIMAAVVAILLACIGIAAIAATGGTATPAVMIAIAALIATMLAAIAAMSVGIADYESQRKGEGGVFADDSARQAFFWTMLVIDIVLCLVGIGAAIIIAKQTAAAAAKVAAEAAKKAAIEAAEEMAEQTVQHTTRVVAQQTAKSASNAATRSTTQTGAQSGAETGVQTGVESGAKSGTQSGVESGTKSGAQSGTQSGARTGAQEGAETSLNTAVDTTSDAASEAVGQSTKKATQKTAEKSAEKTAQELAETSVNQAQKQATETTSREISESMAQETAEAAADAGTKATTQAGSSSTQAATRSGIKDSIKSALKKAGPSEFTQDVMKFSGSTVTNSTQNIMHMMHITQVFHAAEREKAREDFKKSEEKEKLDKKHEEQLATIESQSYRTEADRQKAIDVENKTYETNMRLAEEGYVAANADLDKANDITMAVSIALMVTAIVASLGLMTMANSGAAMTNILRFELFVQMVSSTSTFSESVLEMRNQEEIIEINNKLKDAKALMALLENYSTLLDLLKKNSEKMQKRSMLSMNNLIEALNAAFTANMSAMSMVASHRA